MKFQRERERETETTKQASTTTNVGHTKRYNIAPQHCHTEIPAGLSGVETCGAFNKQRVSFVMGCTPQISGKMPVKMCSSRNSKKSTSRCAYLTDSSDAPCCSAAEIEEIAT